MEDILAILEKNITSCEDDLNRLTQIKQHIVAVLERFREDLTDKPKAEIKPETFISHENLVSRLINEDIVISDGKWKAWVTDGKYYMNTFLEDEDSYLSFKDCFHNFNEWFITPPKEPEVTENKISFQSEEQIQEFLFESPVNQVTDGTVILRFVGGQFKARGINEAIGVEYGSGTHMLLSIKNPSAWSKYVSDKI